MYSQSKKKKKTTPINSNANYRREMKLVPINMDYYLFQFGALKFFLGVHLHGGSLPNFIFFNVNPLIWQQNRKVHRSNGRDTNFHSISWLFFSAIWSLLFKSPGFGPVGPGLIPGAIKDPPSAFYVRSRKIFGSESPVFGHYTQSEYILSDATQIEKSVHQTDELVVPELMRRK